MCAQVFLGFSLFFCAHIRGGVKSHPTCEMRLNTPSDVCTGFPEDPLTWEDVVAIQNVVWIFWMAVLGIGFAIIIIGTGIFWLFGGFDGIFDASDEMEYVVQNSNASKNYYKHKPL